MALALGTSCSANVEIEIMHALCITAEVRLGSKMSEVISLRCELDGLSNGALRALTAAVNYAKASPGDQLYAVPTGKFHDAAGLRGAGAEKIALLFQEAQHAAVIIEAVDALHPDRDDLFWMSIPIIKMFVVNDLILSFALDERIFDERLVPSDFVSSSLCCAINLCVS